MTGIQVTFEKSKSSGRLRKTITFDLTKDRFSLKHINKRIEAGESFNSIIKELVLQQITLLELASTHLDSKDCHHTGMTSHHTGMTTIKDELDSVFDDFMSTE